MLSVTVSPKFQVVIPLAARQKLKLKAGQKVQVLLYNNRIEYIPEQPIGSMRGFLKGIKTDVPREEGDRG
ncbi:MAG: AbrB/MazE/SpoVT family DNA-binding domain-containing protein [bacterium]